jgi:hypothetical protein
MHLQRMQGKGRCRGVALVLVADAGEKRCSGAYYCCSLWDVTTGITREKLTRTLLAFCFAARTVLRDATAAAGIPPPYYGLLVAVCCSGYSLDVAPPQFNLPAPSRTDAYGRF